MASKACCDAGAPVSLDYKEVGRRHNISSERGDLPVYETGTGDKAIIVVYDIFGFDFKQNLQVADRLASAGFTVVVPDVFRGKPAPHPPGPNVMEWIMTNGAFDQVVKDIRATWTYLQGKGISKFGAVGFCWGADIAFRIGTEGSEFVGPLKAVAAAHPSWFGKEKEIAEKLVVPAAICPANKDPMESVKEVLDTRPFASKCVYRRFDDQMHGFVGARGQWDDPKIAAAATEVIQLFQQFFLANVV